MNVFAALTATTCGTMDHDGYGYLGQLRGNNSDITSSVEDLKAADTGGLRAKTGQAKMHFLTAPSSGSNPRRPLFAQAEPERVERLVLVAFTYKGHGRRRRIAKSGKSESSSIATTRAASVMPR